MSAIYTENFTRSKKLILAVIEIFVTVSLFAEYLGNKPSIDFTFSPELFLAFEEKYSGMDIESQLGGGANGNLLINFKLANFIYGYGSTIEKNNVFGFYLKNSYSAKMRYLVNTKFLQV